MIRQDSECFASPVDFVIRSERSEKINRSRVLMFCPTDSWQMLASNHVITFYISTLPLCIESH